MPDDTTGTRTPITHEQMQADFKAVLDGAETGICTGRRGKHDQCCRPGGHSGPHVDQKLTGRLVQWDPEPADQTTIDTYVSESVRANSDGGEADSAPSTGTSGTGETAGERPPSVSPVLVAALDRAWREIQRRHPEVPDVVVTFGAGSIGTRKGELRLGHFAAGRWQHQVSDTSDDGDSGVTGRGGSDGDGEHSRLLAELFIGGEGLKSGAVDVLETLLHEAAHGIAHSRGVKDTSRQGRWHNARFRDIAIELGLDVEQDRYGWNATKVPAATRREYSTVVDNLTAAIVAWRHPEHAHQTGGTGAPGEGDGAGPAGCGWGTAEQQQRSGGPLRVWPAHSGHGVGPGGRPDRVWPVRQRL